MINNITQFVPFIGDYYTEYDMLVMIYKLLFMYCFFMVCCKFLTFLNRK